MVGARLFTCKKPLRNRFCYMAYLTDKNLNIELPLRDWLDFELLCESQGSTVEQEIAGFISNRVLMQRRKLSRLVKEKTVEYHTLRRRVEKLSAPSKTE